MQKTVGIPRALYYFQYGPAWRRFFQELDYPVVLSSPTDGKLIERGAMLSVEEACLPIKILHGHVAQLCEKGVTYIFLPRLISLLKGSFTCPKIAGAPEMIQSAFTQRPILLSPSIRAGENPLTACYELGRELDRSASRVRKAWTVACENSGGPVEKRDPEALRVALLGHPYLLYDSGANMRLREKLEDQKILVCTPDEYDPEDLRERAADMTEKRIFWSTGEETVGYILALLDNEPKPDGFIFVTSFGCGVDSFILNVGQRLIQKKSQIPYLELSLDEHAGEAGFDTRIEAFIDMLERRRERGKSA